MKHAYSCLLMVAVLGFITACGEKGRTTTPSAYTSTLLEKQCLKGDVKQEKVTKDIEDLYNKVAAQAAWVFFSVPERNFDYKNPLVVNLDQLAKKLKVLKEKARDLDFNDQNNRDVTFPISNEIFNLYQDAIRYEGSKCQLRYLSTKKINDIIPYMTLKDYCLSKNEDEFCSADILHDLTDTDALFVKQNTIKMCTQLTGDTKKCEETYDQTVVPATQKLFREKKFDKLFKLKDSHLKFQCEKAENNVMMKVKVYSPRMNQGQLKSVLDAVTTAWSREDFKIAFELVDTKGEDVIEIIPTPRPVSFVMEQNNRLVYLSSQLDIMTKKSVMAHEFGHVLGFPDCYTEYYDSEKKSLIYYEISKDNKNIMCSMKSGVSVPSDYVDQLVQKSCLFSQK